MSTPMRERLGMWLQKWPVLYPWLLVYDGDTPQGLHRYINRVSRHLVIR